MHPELEHIVIIGGGKMGEAILAGLLRSDAGPAADLATHNICVVNPGQARRDYIVQTYGIDCVATLDEVPVASMLVLAVKPQVVPAVLEELSSCEWIANVLAVSIAAGITTATLESALPTSVRVVRVMPNTPLTVGQGMSVIAAGDSAPEHDIQLVCDLFAAMGQALILDEDLIDAVTAVSGSGPAYVAALVEAMARSGAREGLSADVAEQLAIMTVFGTGALLLQNGRGAAQTRKDVCSPGGTTMAALEAMERGGYSKSIEAGVHAATARAKELAS